MQKGLPNEVHIALEIVLEEIEAVFNSLNDEGARAFQEGNYQKAREAIEMATRLADFRKKVTELQNEWGHVFSPALPPPPQRRIRRGRGRLPRGLRTPEHAFRRPILEALIELGGKGPVDKVLDVVERKVKRLLNEHDYGQLSTGDIRWRNTAQWCRNQMVREGLLKADSPRGIWEISEEGRRALEQEHIRL